MRKYVKFNFFYILPYSVFSGYCLIVLNFQIKKRFIFTCKYQEDDEEEEHTEILNYEHVFLLSLISSAFVDAKLSSFYLEFFKPLRNAQ